MPEYTYAGVMYCLMIIGFISLWVWAWSKRRKDTFDIMANLPLEDEPPPSSVKHKSN